MNDRPAGAPSADARIVRRAARAIGWEITLVCAGILALTVGAAVAYVVFQSTPAELLEKPAPGEDRFYADTSVVLSALIVIGVIAVLLAGAASWVIAARATRPLGEALRRQRDFVADAGHELRTPLAVLNARVQLQESKTAEGGPDAAALARIRSDLRVMIDLVNDLLAAADAAGPVGRPNPIETGPIVADVCEGLGLLAAQRDVRLVVTTPSGLTARIAPSNLHRVTSALVDNAIGHAPRGSEVAVELDGDASTVRLRVTDRGSGVAVADRERIFERFARETTPVNPERASHGLGLALARDAVEGVGGRVTVTGVPGRSTVFTVTLPRAR